MTLSKFLRQTGLAAARRAVPPPVIFIASRAASTGAASKVAKVLDAELKHETDNYEQQKEIQQFLKTSPFKLVDKDGDVNMKLERELGDKVVSIEWQLTSPFDPSMGEEEDSPSDEQSVDLTVTVEKKVTGSGITFYCCTQTGEDHRYIIGNVKSFMSIEERDSPSSYNGPEFEDVDEKLQEAFDEYLAEVGMNSELCDFIDACALDKEQREYVRWLKATSKFMAE